MNQIKKSRLTLQKWSVAISIMLRLCGLSYLLLAIWGHNTTDAVLALIFFYQAQEHWTRRDR